MGVPIKEKLVSPQLPREHTKLALQELNQKLICFLCQAIWKLHSIMRTQNVKESNYVFIQLFLWIVINIVNLVKSVSFSILVFRIQLSSKIFLSL